MFNHSKLPEMWYITLNTNMSYKKILQSSSKLGEIFHGIASGYVNI